MLARGWISIMTLCHKLIDLSRCEMTILFGNLTPNFALLVLYHVHNLG